MNKLFSFFEDSKRPSTASSGRAIWNTTRTIPSELMGVPNRLTGVLEQWLEGDGQASTPIGAAFGLTAAEHVVVDGASTSVKLVSLITPRDGMSVEDFMAIGAISMRNSRRRLRQFGGTYVGMCRIMY